MSGGNDVDVTTRKYDVLVIGSGAAGSIAVKELTERGLEVLMLEAGPAITKADFAPLPQSLPAPLDMGIRPRLQAALGGQHVQARRAFFSPAVSPFLVDDRQNPYATPRGEQFLWIRSRVLGGRLNAYGRVLMRMSDYDFKGASFDGQGVDWPISYEDLMPYYERVEEFVGIYGNTDDVPSIPDGTYLGNAKLTSAELDFKAQVEAAWSERRVISWRYAAPNLERVPLGVLAASKTDRLTVRTDAVARRITVDPRTGRANGAVFIDRHDKSEHTVSADVVMLCASTIESVRILLNSASDHHPDGLANSSGLLGQYFMDQTPSLVVGSTSLHHGYETDDSAPDDPYYSAAGGVFIPRYANLEDTRTSEFSRGFSFQGGFGRIPVPEGSETGGGLMGFGEMLPYRHNAVTVHPRRKDKWGVPIASIRCVLGPNENKLIRAQVRAVREMFEGSGYDVTFCGSSLGLDSKDVWPERGPLSRAVFRAGFRRSLALGAAIHECGGIRMGSDPKRSLLNEHNQSWDVPNLFVTDGSAFPSSGSVGPTLTIMALTARAAEYIADQHAQGTLQLG